MTPPFEITDKIVSLLSDISERIGHLTSVTGAKNLLLRKTNRIRTIQGTLAIEQNTMTTEQITAMLNGKIVLAPPKDIAEVKNAYEIYERIDELDPTSESDLLTAHKIMMRGLVEDAGRYRGIPVGVVNSKNEIVHFGTLPQYVPEAVNGLFSWLGESETHPLIKGCVFHYEFELIHPFSDGNGRIGRLWHTLIMTRWNPLFAWLPIESVIYKNQNEYYNAINQCNAAGSSTAFIEFMLKIILSALNDVAEQVEEQVEEQDKEQDKEQVDFEPLLYFCRTPKSRSEMQVFCGITGRKKFTEKYLKPLLTSGRIEMTIPDKPNSKGQKYRATGEDIT